MGFDFDAYGTLQLAYGMQSFHDAATVATFGLSYSLALQRFGYLGLFATHTDSGATDSSILLTWTMPLGERRSASSAVQYSPDPVGSDGGLQAMATVQQNLPTGSGWGYNVSLSTRDEANLGVAYQGHAGLATLDYSRRGDSSGVRAGAAGGVAITGAGVMPARRLEQSFAVVQVADYAGPYGIPR